MELSQKWFNKPAVKDIWGQSGETTYVVGIL